MNETKSHFLMIRQVIAAVCMAGLLYAGLGCQSEPKDAAVAHFETSEGELAPRELTTSDIVDLVGYHSAAFEYPTEENTISVGYTFEFYKEGKLIENSGLKSITNHAFSDNKVEYGVFVKTPGPHDERLDIFVKASATSSRFSMGNHFFDSPEKSKQPRVISWHQPGRLDDKNRMILATYPRPGNNDFSGRESVPEAGYLVLAMRIHSVNAEMAERN